MKKLWIRLDQNYNMVRMIEIINPNITIAPPRSNVENTVNGCKSGELLVGDSLYNEMRDVDTRELALLPPVNTRRW